MHRHHSNPVAARLTRHLATSPGAGLRAAVLLVLLCASLAPRAQQQEPPSEVSRPTGSAPELQVVDAEQLIQMALADPQLVLVDSRIPTDRQYGYIEGSVSLPDVDTNCDSLAHLLPSLSTPAVFYCNGVKCNRSATAARIAQGCGYTHSYWFRGGLDEWLSKGYPTLVY